LYEQNTITYLSEDFLTSSDGWRNLPPQCPSKRCYQTSVGRGQDIDHNSGWRSADSSPSSYSFINPGRG